MSNNDTMRDVRHIKAARELLRWDQVKLAEMAGLSLVSVRRYEAARQSVADDIETAIVASLKRAGVVFVPAGDHGDVETSGGVVLLKSAKPEPLRAKTVYVYADGKKAGRPPGGKP